MGTSGNEKLQALESSTAANIENKVGQKVQAAVAAKKNAIMNAEKAKVQTEMQNADVSGAQKTVLESKLRTQAAASVANKMAGQAEQIAAKVHGSVQAKERAKLEAKKFKMKATLRKVRTRL